MEAGAIEIRGFKVYKSAVGRDEQARIVRDIRHVVAAAPLFSPDTPFGKPMSVRMTSAGRFGWFSDRKGYRYSATHPDGQPWPEIPSAILSIWARYTGLARQPDCCLINFYDGDARMGMH